MTRTIEANQLGDVLNGLVSDLANDSFTAGLEACRDPIAAGFSEIFSAQEGADGESWPEHSPVTVAMYGPHPLLRLSDDLYESMTGDSPNHVESILDRHLQWGTDLVYANAQNFGFGQIPPREFAYFTEDSKDGCADVLMDYIETEILGAMT